MEVADIYSKRMLIWMEEARGTRAATRCSLPEAARAAPTVLARGQVTQRDVALRLALPCPRVRLFAVILDLNSDQLSVAARHHTNDSGRNSEDLCRRTRDRVLCEALSRDAIPPSHNSHAVTYGLHGHAARHCRAAGPVVFRAEVLRRPHRGCAENNAVGAACPSTFTAAAVSIRMAH